MKYGNISEIAQYNRENGTNFYTMEQVERHKRKNSAEEFEKKHPFLASLSKSAKEARDARIGAVGAEQVRDLYNKGENELASELNNKYLGANASGILSAPLAGEFITYGPLVGALRLGAGTAGSAAGSYIAGKTGDFADKKLGTNWIGDTGRLLGGFAGFGAGMKTTTPLIRSAATRGLTLHMPQDTFIKVRGEGFDRAFNKVNTQSFPLENKTIAIPLKQTRVVSEGTYPLYTGPKHSVTEVVNPDGTVNPRAALRIEREVADNIPGAYRIESRLENPEWHVNDPNTWAHTRNVAQSAWTIPTPKGLTKQDQMVTALGHDFGKMVSGDGHAQSSAALIEQIFPDITKQQLTAISEHMGAPKSILGKVTKQADILNGKPAITRFVGDNGKIRLRLPSHTVEKPRELVLDPQGNNKFRIHTRTWDGDHIPAEMSAEDKNTLFNALYEELPEGSEILFPESGPGNYATRGTVAGLQRLARDSRFKPTGNGVLQYVDKDGSIKTFEGTGFRKPKLIKPLSRPISEFEKNGRFTLDELHEMGFKLPRKHLQGEDAVKMFKEYGTQYPETTRLYRITGTSGKFSPSPDGTVEFAGQWFTTNPTKTLGYGSETVKRARIAKVENPIELQVVDIPNSQLNRYKAKNILKGRSDVEYEPTEDFLIPLDIPRGRAPITLTGNRLVDSHASLPQISTQDTPLMQQLRKYIPEVRERYGLVGNTNITDDEIAGSLYKKALELGGNTAAVNEVGEPLVLFRGDTKRYLALKPRMSPEELATKRGTMDNSLGTLFLDFPNHYQGADRYLGTIRNFNGNWEYLNSGTGSKVIGGSREFDPTSGFPKGTYKLYSGLYGKRQTPISVWKLPGSQMESGINDLNGFVVRTKSVRDATPEISVLNDDWLAKGAVGSKPHMKTILIEDENGFPLFKHPDGSVTEALAGMDNRPGMAEHYRFVLDDAKSKEQGLLWSRSGAPLRDEHTNYNYYALPNFNILGAKHILPFDLKMPTQWGSRIIYRKQGGILKAQKGKSLMR